MWADDGKFKDRLKDYLKLVDERADEKDISEARKSVDRYKRDHFPLRWRYVSPRGTWPQWSDEIHLPEVVEIRKLHKEDIEADYGIDAVPAELRSSPATQLIDVFVYTNWVWTGTLVAYRENLKLVHEFEHGLGMSPYILMEAGVLNDDIKGRRWKSSLFHIIDTVVEHDKILSDYAHNHHMNALRPVVSYHDPTSLEGNDPLLAGRPKSIPIKPGPETVPMWNTEKLELAPVPEINAQAVPFLSMLRERIDSAFLQPHLGGEAKSGESNVLYNTRFQISDRQFQKYMRAISDGAEYWGKLAFRCVNAINIHFEPSEADEVYVISEEKGWLGVSPKDVEGFENSLQARIDRELPINMSAKSARALQLRELGLPMTWILESVLNIENPEEMIDKAFVESAVAAMQPMLLQMIQEHAGMIIQAAASGEGGDLADQIQSLPSEIQRGLQTAGVAQAGGAGQMGTAVANQMRGPQAPTQNTVGQEIEPLGAA